MSPSRFSFLKLLAACQPFSSRQGAALQSARAVPEMPSQDRDRQNPQWSQQARFLQQTAVLFSHHLFLPVLSHEKAAGHPLRAPVLNQPHMVFADDLVRELALVSNPVNFLHPKRLIGPWLTGNRLDGSDLERRRDLFIFDLANQVLIPKLIQAIDRAGSAVIILSASAKFLSTDVGVYRR